MEKVFRRLPLFRQLGHAPVHAPPARQAGRCQGDETILRRRLPSRFGRKETTWCLKNNPEDESGDWEEEGRRFAGVVGSIACRRCFGGDFRSLYLGWLASLQAGELGDNDEVEPPVPPGTESNSRRRLGDLADFSANRPTFLDPPHFSAAALVMRSTRPPGRQTRVEALALHRRRKRPEHHVLVVIGAGTPLAACRPERCAACTTVLPCLQTMLSIERRVSSRPNSFWPSYM